MIATAAAHRRGGSDAAAACEALKAVVELIKHIWTNVPDRDADVGPLEQLQRSLLPSVELVAAIALHRCDCEPKISACASCPCVSLLTARVTKLSAVECLESLSSLVGCSSRVRSIARDRLDPLLQPLARSKLFSEGPACGHHSSPSTRLASAFGLTVRRRCANLDCEIADEPDADATALKSCARCKMLYVCASTGGWSWLTA